MSGPHPLDSADGWMQAPSAASNDEEKKAGYQRGTDVKTTSEGPVTHSLHAYGVRASTAGVNLSAQNRRRRII